MLVALEFAWTVTLDLGVCHCDIRLGQDTVTTPIDASFKKRDTVWRRFTAALTRTVSPGMRAHGRRGQTSKSWNISVGG